MQTSTAILTITVIADQIAIDSLYLLFDCIVPK